MGLRLDIHNVLVTSINLYIIENVFVYSQTMKEWGVFFFALPALSCTRSKQSSNVVLVICLISFALAREFDSCSLPNCSCPSRVGGTVV